MTIDSFFAIGFLLCALCGRDGFIVSLSAFVSLYIASETGLHMIYCNALMAILLFSAVSIINNHKIKYYVFAIAALNLCAAVDYFTPDYTWFYLAFPWAIMTANTLLILEIFKRGSRDESIIADIDSLVFHVKSCFQYFKIEKGV